MMKRGLSILLTLCLLAGSMLLPAQGAFTDIPEEGTALAAAALESMGVVSGTSETEFSPDSLLTRAQLCVMAVRLMGLGDSVSAHSYKTLFTDVPAGQWYTGFVNLAYAQGIINGYGNGAFGPNDPLTGGQLVTVALRLLGYTSGDIGAVWPVDYVRFAEELGLSEGVEVSGTGTITRGETARILCHLLSLSKKGSSAPYYQSISGLSSTVEAILLEVDSDTLTAATVGGGSLTVETYPHRTPVSSVLTGRLGRLLLNTAGQVVGFVPGDSETAELTISSAKSSSITDTAGITYRIGSGATVIAGGSTHPYASSGYLLVNSAAGQRARLFYNDSGSVSCIYLGAGLSGSSGRAVAAETDAPASELARALGISSMQYTITKNGGAAEAEDLAKYDVAYYDGATKTMRVSDYQLTGVIEEASPNVAAAETITVEGCTVEVLECAWDSLESFKLGDRVTLRLTDDNRVAAACIPSRSSADMVGVLSTNGTTITLSDSGLVLRPSALSASAALRGSVVRVTSAESGLTCHSLQERSGKLDMQAHTLGSFDLAPSCAIYEWGGSGYVYSLAGAIGTPSRDFSEITWTDRLSADHVSSYGLNSAGQVDVLVLEDVTGNCYSYGRLERQEDGSNQGGVQNDTVTVTNSAGTSGRYLCAQRLSGSYGGVALKISVSGQTTVTDLATLTGADADVTEFVSRDGQWCVLLEDRDIPVSQQVEVYISSIEKWYSGEEGLLTALSSGLELTVHYDRTAATGAQIRVIVAE